jgi:glycosyltransferase involved in cell wall biosynthesis
MRVVARPAFKNAARQPYNARLYGALRELGTEVVEYGARALLAQRCDVVHVHWPESLLETSSRARAGLSARYQLALIDLARRRGAKLVWTAHELKPHDLVFPELERRFHAALLRRVDAWIALSRTGERGVRAQHPQLAERPACVIPLGHYRAESALPERAEARRRLGLADGARVLVHFGHLRPYKNVPALIRAVRSSPEPDLVLWVCGRLGKRVAVEEEIRAAAGSDPRVHLELRHVSDEELALRVRAADLLVFPFHDVLHSSSALFGLSCDRPILVSGQGALPELAQDVGADWVRVYPGELDTATLSDALAWARGAPRGTSAPLDAFEWRGIARRTLDFYVRIVGGEVRGDP